MVTRMLGLTGVLVVSGDVVKSMSRTKVQVCATSHASEVPSYRLVDELLPDPVTMLFGLPVTKLFKELTPLLT